MTDLEAQSPGPDLTTDDMRKWLADQVRDAAKAQELRIKEATAFVNDYVDGKISREQMSQRLYQYDKRWGEALPGAFTGPGISDEEILTRMDKAQAKSIGPHTEKFGAKVTGDKRTSL